MKENVYFMEHSEAFTRCDSIISNIEETKKELCISLIQKCNLKKRAMWRRRWHAKWRWRWRAMRYTWRHYLRSTTIPGLQNVAHASGRAVIFWVVLVLAGTACTIRDVYTVTADFLAYPVLTTVTLDQVTSLPFPAVTVCNLNRIHCTSLRQLAAKNWGSELGTKLLHLHDLTDCHLHFRRRRDIQDNVSTLSTVGPEITTVTSAVTTEKPVNQTQEFNELMHFMAIYTNFSIELRQQMGHSFGEFIRSCSFSGKDCYNDSLYFKQSSNTGYGNCFTFHTNRKTVIPGKNYGLSMELFLDQANYLRAGLSPQAGARVVVHDSTLDPLPETGLSVSPHTATNIGLLQVQISRQKAPYPTNCSSGWQRTSYANIVDRTYTYSHEHCQRLCLQLAFEERCQCSHPAYMDLERGFVPCNLTSNTDASWCTKRVLEEFESRTRSCSCNIDCKEVTYETRISTATWPTDSHWCSSAHRLSLVNSCGKADQEFGGDRRRAERLRMQSNLLRVNVYFESLRVRFVNQEPAFQLQALVASLGGALSLYLGVTLLMLVEAVELIGRLLCAFIHPPSKVLPRGHHRKLPRPIFFTGRFTPPHRPVVKARFVW